ncbi:hypothetical protein ACRQ1B_03310 [Rhizobium panacihumi]|uniref:hypothetical protein n=1 Tax=Rhizobium panacihumi TaxID=2008450 RepID=UPI003D79D068
MTIRQADLARELEVSEMTVHRVLKTLHRNGQPLTELDAILVFTCAELQALERLNAPTSLRIIGEVADEIRYVAADRKRRCWVVFVENANGSFRLPALSAAHYEALLCAFPLSLVLPLHQVVSRAVERLDGLQAKLSREAA